MSNGVLPSAPAVEKKVLAAILRKPALFDLAQAEGLTAAAFQQADYRRIFETIGAEAAAGRSIDEAALLTLLPDDVPLLAELLTETIATDANFPEWLAMLRKYQAARGMIAQTARIQREAASSPAEVEKLLDDMEAATIDARRLLAADQGGDMTATVAEVEYNLDHPRMVLPLFPVGSEAAEAVQLHPGEMLVIGAKTGFGKTALAAGFAAELTGAGRGVLYVCTESSSADILARLAGAESGVSHFRATAGRASAEEKQRFRAAIDAFKARKLVIRGCERGIITAATVRDELRKMRIAFGRCDVVIIDFLQGLSAMPNLSRASALEQITRTVTALHDLFIQAGAAGIVISQFNRAGQMAGGDDGLPNLTWLKDTSSLEQLAHTVAFLYRQKADDAKTVFFSAKTRNQAPFTVALGFDGARFTSAPRFPTEGRYSHDAAH